jgi:hypothetical protein
MSILAAKTWDIYVRKAVMHIQLPIVCSVCGMRGLSESIEVTVEHAQVCHLAEAINRQQLGTRFPVGWAKFHGVPRDVLKCPNCSPVHGEITDYTPPQFDIDWALSVEQSVRDSERQLYLECMNDVPMSTRVAAPRELDGVGRDVRDGCILTGVFCRCRVNTDDTPGVTHG